jgi:hypothetical protein
MKRYLLGSVLALSLLACSDDEVETIDTGITGEDIIENECYSDYEIDQTHGACDQTLSWSSAFSSTEQNGNRLITANSIPDHMVGLFGNTQGALNPNAISEQSESYTLDLDPSEATSFTSLLSTTGSGPSIGPQYTFGILFSGVELDPVAAEPFPHEGMFATNVNWEWNLEALNVNLGLDCNSAHVQPTGKYHYHGKPTLYLESLNIPSTTMTLVGYAADGFPIYYKYAYSTSGDAGSAVTEMSSSYQLKTGQRPGDGVTAPCGYYDGVYSNDYEFVSGLGDLDEANGRNGVTPEYPGGTYYYIITDAFPSIPRYFRGTPSDYFKIGA